MAINFNTLPDSANQNVLISGKTKVKVKKAEMKQKNDGTGEYMNVLLEAFNEQGATMGTFFDIISESDKALPQYKLKRFIIGFGLPISGTFELKDLCKIVVGKEAYAELKIDEREGYAAKTVVDATKDEIYYPINATAQTPTAAPMPGDSFEQAEADLPFGGDEEF